jgi:hypothetical protein
MDYVFLPPPHRLYEVLRNIGPRIASEKTSQFLGAFAKFRKMTVSFVLSFYPSARRERNFMKFDIGVFFENLPRHLKLY